MKVMTVVGARPQFIKTAVLSRELARIGVEESLVHTGQHYDDAMSEVFFRELAIRPPAHNLGIGSGTHGEQTGRMLEALERVMLDERPERVLVYGDTNSTVAAALCAAKLAVPIDHIEAGVRSFDHDMPEEINRIITDQLADQLYCPTATAVSNLAREGVCDGVHHAGDVMLDLAIDCRTSALALALPGGLREGEYFVATVHRPSNTEDADRLAALLRALDEVGSTVSPVILPAHPRLARRIASHPSLGGAVRVIEPVGYLEMQGLILRARGVITDSGGVQKEAAFHGVRCITLRDSTEWPETVSCELNVLLGDDLASLAEQARECGGRSDPPAQLLREFGGGTAAARIAGLIVDRGGARRRWRRR
jgi:UDP-GlcNAc3NAcA epimerase